MKNEETAGLARCFACRLPTDVKDALHRERFENYRTLDELAQWLSSNGHDVSESSLRRHFRRHATSLLADSTIPPLTTTLSGERATTAFDSLPAGSVNECLVLEASTQALLAKLRTVDTNSRDGLAQFLKLNAALERSLKQLQVARGPITEARRVYARAIDVIADSVVGAVRRFMTYQVEEIRRIINAHLEGRLDGAQFVKRLSRWESEWGSDLASRVGSDANSALASDELVSVWRKATQSGSP